MSREQPRSRRLPLTGPEPARIRTDYEPQFAAAERLLNAVWDTAPTAPSTEFDLVLMNFLGRSIGTFRAILRLLEGGFTDQVWMLNRALFEDMVAAYWLALPANRDRAASLAEAHNEETSERIDGLLDQINTDDGEAFLAPDAANWKARSNLTKVGLDKMVEQIVPLWEESGGSAKELRVHNRVTHWVSNLHLHASGNALHQTMSRGQVRVGSATLYGYGQTSSVSESQMTWCFRAAAFRLGFLARLVFLERDLPLEALEVAYADMRHANDALSPTMRHKLGRNDECWCGSGKKLKKCHAA